MNDKNLRPHARHADKTEDVGNALQAPSKMLTADSPEVNALLEDLDDAIFAALQGNPQALQQAYTLWPQVVGTIGWDLVEESREQYLRYAIEITRSCDQANIRTPEHTLAAIEVISLLTKN